MEKFPCLIWCDMLLVKPVLTALWQWRSTENLRSCSFAVIPSASSITRVCFPSTMEHGSLGGPTGPVHSKWWDGARPESEETTGVHAQGARVSQSCPRMQPPDESPPLADASPTSAVGSRKAESVLLGETAWTVVVVFCSPEHCCRCA